MDTNKELLEKYSQQPDVLGGKKRLCLDKNYELFEEAQEYIPGGLLGARNPHQFIYGEYPIFFEKGKGCHVWDPDDNEFIDYLAGFGPTTLGLGIEEIDNAVFERIKEGMCFSTANSLQTELAKKIRKYFPCAERTLLCKTGTDTTVIATRIARAFTGKELILTDGYHGWADFSQYGEDGGVLDCVREKTVRIDYGDYEGYAKAVEAGNVACILITPYPAAPFKTVSVNKEFIRKIRELCTENNIPLIFDEIRTAFRFAMGGVAEMIGVQPDVICMAKAFANGYSIAAVGGREDIMNTLTLGHSKEGTFVSSTYFPNCLEMTAAIKTIDFYEEHDVIKDINEKGKYFLDGLKSLAEKYDAPVMFEEAAAMPAIMFDYNRMTEEEFYARTLTLYTYLIRSGIFIHPFRQMYVTYTHTYEDLDYTLSKFDEGLALVKSMYTW